MENTGRKMKKMMKDMSKKIGDMWDSMMHKRR